MERFDFFCAVGTDKQQLIETLEFLVPRLHFSITGFCQDTKGPLVLCHPYDSHLEDGKFQKYPFTVNASTVAEHILTWISELSEEQLEKMKCVPDGYEEDYEIGWCIFTPDWYSDEYEVDCYSYGETLLAVKPRIVQYGK